MLSVQFLFGFLTVHPLGYFVVISQNTWLRKLGPPLPFDIWFISWRRANSCWVGTTRWQQTLGFIPIPFWRFEFFSLN